MEEAIKKLEEAYELLIDAIISIVKKLKNEN